MARIFGWELSFSRRNRPRLPLVSPFQLVDQEPEGGADPKKPKKSWVDSPVLTYANQGSGGFRRAGRSSLVSVGPEYDLVELGRAEDVDSYLNQSNLKKTSLMFKEGFDYIGANPRTIEYLRARFDQIANATGIPHEALLHRVGGYLIRRSNAFLIKVRNRQASGGDVRKSKKGKRLDPVAGYYPAPPEMMEADLDEHGQVRLWRQRTPSGSFVEFSPEDVVHFTFNRKEGFVFGTPVAVPVLDDIRALRRIEENIELLVYHHLFPIFHYKVGTPEQPCGLTEDGEREVEVAKTELQLMPAEGGIVTSERHEIKLLGSESRALRAEPYVEHFKKRVFAGLGMSAIDYGEGESSNRSTAESMSLALIDSVKHIQDVLESQWYEFIIRELLLESSFGEEALRPENRVALEFREIDLDKQIKTQTHAADQFSKQAITHDELRKLIGRQPWQLPVQGEETDPKKLAEWNKSHWKLFHEPELLIRAIDEKFQGAATEAVMESPSTGMTPEDVKAAEERKKSELKTQAALKLAARSKSKPVKRKDNFLGIYFDAFEEALIEELRKDNISTGIITAKREMLERRMVDNLASRMHSTFLEQMGIQAATGEFLNVNIQSRDLFHSRAALIVGRLMRDAERLALRNSHLDGVERVAAARSAISSIRYRVRFINDVEAPRAGSWGRAIRGSIEGRDGIQFRTSSGACENCLRKAGAVLPLDRASLEDMVPHHAECHCEMAMVNIGMRTDSAEDSEINDADKLERCVLKIKSQLRAKNPGMSERVLKQKAFAICNASLNK